MNAKYRCMAVLAIAFFMLHGENEDELISDGALQQIQTFLDQNQPEDIAIYETDKVTALLLSRAKQIGDY